MTAQRFIRSIIIGFLVAMPAPFLVQWLIARVSSNLNVALFFSIYLLAFIGCLLMGIAEDKIAPETDYMEDNGRERGQVKWFNVSKGFGFITRESGEDVFVHFRSIRGEGRRILRDGQSVRFKVVEGEKGLQAEDVSPVRKS